jgi:cytochrome oxidase Cu insertion factor (SCO1/SenC/PrrC family)
VTEPRIHLPPAWRRLPLRLVALALLGAVALGGAGGALLRELRPSAAIRPALPGLHGQAVWAAGARPAPGFALTDQSGATVSLAALRGKPVLLTFLDSQCRAECPIEGRQLGTILQALPAAQRPTLVVVSVDHAGDTPAGIRHALAEWQLRGPWTTYWLNGTSRAQLATVWRDYGVLVQPKSNDIVHSLALYLIDRRGDERTAYLFPFLPGFVQGDLARLAKERA